MWDERYSGDDFAYGIHPNDFLVSAAEGLPIGKALSLAEGEGRNAVWLAQQGFDVTAVDMSQVGLEKAQTLADTHGAPIRTIHANLADFVIKPEEWNVIVSVFCHLPPPLRRMVHTQSVAGLRANGVFLLEAYTPTQLSLGTGGPPSPDMMMDLETLRDELTGLDLIHAKELTRTIHEGEFHNGPGAVVQVVGVKR